MPAYICKMPFNTCVIIKHGSGRLTYKRIQEGEKFDLDPDYVGLDPTVKNNKLENEDEWIEVSNYTLKKYFERDIKHHPQPDENTLGYRVRLLRNKRKMSQQKLSQKLGISTSVLNSVELNKHDPSLTTLLAIADYFEVSLDWIVGRNINVQHYKNY